MTRRFVLVFKRSKRYDDVEVWIACGMVSWVTGDIKGKTQHIDYNTVDLYQRGFTQHITHGGIYFTTSSTTFSSDHKSTRSQALRTRAWKRSVGKGSGEHSGPWGCINPKSILCSPSPCVLISFCIESVQQFQGSEGNSLEHWSHSSEAILVFDTPVCPIRSQASLLSYVGCLCRSPGRLLGTLPSRVW